MTQGSAKARMLVRVQSARPSKEQGNRKMKLFCRIFGHRWKVIYTDDDECTRCKTIRYWPMVARQEHLWRKNER